MVRGAGIQSWQYAKFGKTSYHWSEWLILGPVCAMILCAVGAEAQSGGVERQVFVLQVRLLISTAIYCEAYPRIEFSDRFVSGKGGNLAFIQFLLLSPLGDRRNNERYSIRLLDGSKSSSWFDIGAIVCLISSRVNVLPHLYE